MSEESICTETFCGSKDAFCRREVSVQRLFEAAKMHFVGGKHLPRGFLWQRRYILSEGSICTEAFCGSEDTFYWRKVSAKYPEEQMKIHPPGWKYLQNAPKSR